MRSLTGGVAVIGIFVVYRSLGYEAHTPSIVVTLVSFAIFEAIARTR